MHTVTDVSPQGAAGRVAGTLALPHSHASVRLARARLATDLLSRDLPARVVQDALLVLTEILTNAIRHAPPLPSGLVRMSWELTADSVRIEITDGGSPDWLGQALASGGPRSHPRPHHRAYPSTRGMKVKSETGAVPVHSGRILHCRCLPQIRNRERLTVGLFCPI